MTIKKLLIVPSKYFTVLYLQHFSISIVGNLSMEQTGAELFIDSSQNSDQKSNHKILPNAHLLIHILTRITAEHNIPVLSLFYTGTARHTMIGYGLCRGPDWQNGQWPHDEGFETLDQCSLECEKRPGCTGIFTLFLEKEIFLKKYL